MLNLLPGVPLQGITRSILQAECHTPCTSTITQPYVLQIYTQQTVNILYIGTTSVSFSHIRSLNVY